MKRIILLFLVFIAGTSLAFAGGETGADVLKTEAGGRATSLGGAFSAIGSGIEAMLYNPAGVSFIKGKELEYMHYFSYGDIIIDHVSYGQDFDIPLISGTFGISLLYRHMDAISNEDATDDSVNFYDFFLTGTYASAIGDSFKGTFFENLRMGLNVKIIFENIGIYQGTTFAFDLGTHLRVPGTGLMLAVVIQNAGAPMKIISEDAPLPLTFRSGIAYETSLDEENVFTVGVDYIQDFYEYARFAIGIEDELLKVFSVRAGYNVPVDSRSPSFLSGGVGISVTQFNVTVSLNYSYRPVLWDWLNNYESSHMFSAEIKI